jgi:peptidoglycan/LPS O-acetylase OafA/YrhL
MENQLSEVNIITLPTADGATQASRSAARTAATRLASIDALRGLAASVVTFGHGLTATPLAAPALNSAFGIFFWLATPIVLYGYTGVFLFFVISGFCIHLRWTKARAAGVAHPKIDFIPFWKRRIRRLYPAYLVALALYLISALQLGQMPANWFTVYDTVMHLLMLHNLDSRTCYSINGVFWTLAIEEQLYLAYFLLLILRQRLGWRWTLALTFAARVGWFGMCFVAHRALGWEIPAYEAALSNWCVWTLGAVSVEAFYGVIKLPRWCYSLRLGGLVLLAAALVAYGGRLSNPRGLPHHFAWLITTPLWGAGFFFVINYLTAAEARWKLKLRVPALVRWSAVVGVFSYSLYLTHELVLGYPSAVLGDWLHLSETGRVALRALLLCPASLLLARVFFEFFEKPFLTQPANNKLVVATEAR